MLVSVDDAEATLPTLVKFCKQAGVFWDGISMVLITAVITPTCSGKELTQFISVRQEKIACHDGLRILEIWVVNSHTRGVALYRTALQFFVALWWLPSLRGDGFLGGALW